jgi:N-acetylmuramoyl-L-alanine amidase
MRRWRIILVCLLAGLLSACGLHRNGSLIIDRSIVAKSQNSRVEFVVLHYTSTGNEASLKILSQLNVSSHYLITREPRPRVYQLVDESRRAWHAGLSEWYGRTDMNSASIGIEIVNNGNEDGSWEPYTPEQIDTLVALLKDIGARHQIKPANIIGHSDIAAQRKIDPGPLFPWGQLAVLGLGRWFDANHVREYEAEFHQRGLPDTVWIQGQLRRLGYAVPATGKLDRATRNVIAAFQMHFRPALYDGEPDAETLAIMKALR